MRLLRETCVCLPRTMSQENSHIMDTDATITLLIDRHRHKQTDRQTDRQTDKQADRQRDRQTQRQARIHILSQTRRKR